MPEISTPLTPAEREALYVLIEEMGEAIKAASKVLRHGKKAVDLSRRPNGVTYDNLQELSFECADVMAAMRLCDARNLLVGDRDQLVADKLRDMNVYLHHNDSSQLALDMGN